MHIVFDLNNYRLTDATRKKHNRRKVKLHRDPLSPNHPWGLHEGPIKLWVSVEHGGKVGCRDSL